LSTRELLLICIVFGICLLAFIRPKYGLYGYLWYGLMRPDVLAWVEDSRNVYSLIIFAATAISALRYIQNFPRLIQSGIIRSLLLLQLFLGISVITAVRYDLSIDRYIFFMKMFIALLLIPMLIETEEDMRHLLITIGLSLGFVGLKYGAYGVAFGGVELIRGYGPMLSDNNFLGVGLVTVMPICWWARSLTTNRFFRLALLGMVLFSIPAIIMTNSRGAVITMGVVMLYIFVRSRNKAFAVVLIGACLAGGIYLVKNMFVDRMSTLSAPEDETSAASRLWHLQAALRMWKDHPIFGVGFGGINYAALVASYGGEHSKVLANHVAHDSYVEMLVDSGFSAFLVYTGTLFYAILWLGRSRKRMKERFPADLARAAIPTGLQGALLAFAIDSTFYSCQRMDLPYMLLLAVGVWSLIEKQILAAPPAATASAPAAPFPVARNPLVAGGLRPQAGMPVRHLGQAR
jgi:probable O-glycosylation ligase (exosortase A-associated)